MAENMFRPPTNRWMRTLDRSFFKRSVELKAARVFDNKNIASCRSALEKSKDALAQPRLGSVYPDPDPNRAQAGKKCIVLRPEIRIENTSVSQNNGTEGDSHGLNALWPHSPTVAELVKQELISVVPFQLSLEYDYWTYHDIMSAVLPEDEQGEIPSGFTQVGHVAHLNLRDEYLKYKHLIAEILVDKNTGVWTVINKIDDVGEENEFRTFKYEVLAGSDDMNVTVSEENCTFKFDFSKVYWNSRLQNEHRRLVSQFQEGEAVCDVMAGIGPFAVPAGKKHVFVWANDLNPDSYASLQDAITRNKVQDYVSAFNEDGRTFIPSAVAQLAQIDKSVNIMSEVPRKVRSKQANVLKTLHQPRTFQHFVLNLPASALTFLPSFIGLYTGMIGHQETNRPAMPLIHVYCFSTKSDTNIDEGIKICEEISQQLKHDMKPGQITNGDVEVYDVRDVAPKKRMFCASFRLPEEVAYR